MSHSAADKFIFALMGDILASWNDTAPSLALEIVVGRCAMCLHHWSAVTHWECWVLYGPITTQLLASLTFKLILWTAFCTFFMEITISGIYLLNKKEGRSFCCHFVLVITYCNTSRGFVYKKHRNSCCADICTCVAREVVITRSFCAACVLLAQPDSDTVWLFQQLLYGSVK